MQQQTHKHGIRMGGKLNLACAFIKNQWRMLQDSGGFANLHESYFWRQSDNEKDEELYEPRLNACTLQAHAMQAILREPSRRRQDAAFLKSPLSSPCRLRIPPKLLS